MGAPAAPVSPTLAWVKQQIREARWSGHEEYQIIRLIFFVYI
jgi:hypothetical protein